MLLRRNSIMDFLKVKESGQMNILSFSGFIPEQICDTVRFVRYQGQRRISHYCGYAADFVSQVLDDPRIDGCVFPRSCDSTRVMASYISGSGKFVHRLHIPARRDETAVSYLAQSIRQYQSAVEEHYGVKLDDTADRAEMVNARNQAIAGLYAAAPDISYSAYIHMIHDLLQKPLRQQVVPDALPGGAGGKPVYLVGSTLCGVELPRLIEDAGMKIVGDRLTESKRLFSAPAVQPSGDIYENIAASMLQNRVSPTQSDFASILREDREEIERKRVKGVIFITQKYCEPYDYLRAVYMKMLEQMAVPVLQLSLTDSTDSRRFDTSIETFADIL